MTGFKMSLGGTAVRTPRPGRRPAGLPPLRPGAAGSTATRAAAGAPQACREPTEEAIHRAVVDFLRRAAKPRVAWTHIPSGEVRGPGVGGKLVGLGTQPGWPDLILVYAGRLHGLELKRPGGRVSPAQERAHAELVAAGATIGVAYGLDEALDVLRAWGLVRA